MTTNFISPNLVHFPSTDALSSVTVSRSGTVHLTPTNGGSRYLHAKLDAEATDLIFRIATSALEDEIKLSAVRNIYAKDAYVNFVE